MLMGQVFALPHSVDMWLAYKKCLTELKLLVFEDFLRNFFYVTIDRCNFSAAFVGFREMSSKAVSSIFHSFPSPPQQGHITVYENVGELFAVAQDSAKLKVPVIFFLLSREKVIFF